MKKIIFLLAILLPVCLQAQDEKVQVTAEEVSETYAETISAHDLKAHLTFISHDLLEGRETGERGQHIAGLYLATQFQKMGLAPGAGDGYFQKFYLFRSEINNISMSFGKKTYEFRKDFFTFGAHGIPETLAGNFVYAGYGITGGEKDNLKGIDLKDKIAVIFSGGPEDGEAKSMRWQIMGWIERAKELKKTGAKAAMMVLPDSIYSRIRPYARKRSLVTGGKDNVGFPLFFLSESMGTDLFKTAKTDVPDLKSKLANSEPIPTLEFKKMKFSYNAEVKTNDIEASNVLGYLEGTDKKDELVIITAHYDHLGIKNEQVYNGADDDGTGTVTVLELAEAFSNAAKEGHRPRRSILFMPVSGEEKGLLGSDFYVENPIYPLEKTVADLNIDMIGRIDPDYKDNKDSANYVYLIGADKLSTELHNLSEAANKDHTGLILDYRYNDESDPHRYYYRSDHYNFAKKNIPVIFYFTGTHKDYHKPTDTIEKIHFERAEKIARLIFHTAWDLANREERIVVDKPTEEETGR